MSIFKYLDTSILHFSQDGINFLEKAIANIKTSELIVSRYTDGYFISLPTDIDNVKIENSVKDVLKYAKEKSCYAVKVDSKAKNFPDLPVYVNNFKQE
jgi:hypothetical protein